MGSAELINDTGLYSTHFHLPRLVEEGLERIVPIRLSNTASVGASKVILYQRRHACEWVRCLWAASCIPLCWPPSLNGFEDGIYDHFPCFSSLFSNCFFIRYPHQFIVSPTECCLCYECPYLWE